MRSFLRRKFAGLRGCSSGNATMILALGLPVFLGAAGYTTEMAQAYAWKRELQHSVDQAALAAAWALAHDKNTTTYTTRAQQEFDLNQMVTKTFADADATVQPGKYGSSEFNSVIVSASASKRLPFSGYLFNQSMTVFASAQATYASGTSHKACLMALKKGAGATEVFTVGGSAQVNASCGLGALSCEEDAIKIEVKDDPSKSGVVTNSIVTCGTADVPEYLQGKVTEGESGLSSPFQGLPTPVTDETGKTLNCPNGNDASNTTTYITPGVYTNGMNMNCKISMAKGIYVVNGGTLDMSGNKTSVNGSAGVMFVLRNGAQLKLDGSGNAGVTVDLSPLEAAYFTGTANDAYKNLYAGMLIYEEKGTRTSTVAHSFTGNAAIKVRGTFYLPNGDLTLNGNSSAEALCFQLWTYTLKITGNTSITTTCTSTQTNSAGGGVKRVRLVA